MKTEIVPGSIAALAQQGNKSIAEALVDADVVILVDTSGSMSSPDGRGGMTRYDTACAELADLQTSLPGKLAVFSFSDTTEFCPGGVPTFLQSGTDMLRALHKVKPFDLPGMRFILISDGEPDQPAQTMELARTFKNKIDVIYVGPETRAAGREYLQKLAAATGGKSVTSEGAKQLASTMRQLLSSGA